MKYKYKIEIHPYGSLMFILPEEIKYVSDYISEMKSESLLKWYLDAYDLVLDGKSEKEERGGEYLTATIFKDFTYLEDNFNLGRRSKIETIEMKNLIEAWWNEYIKFINNKNLY